MNQIEYLEYLKFCKPERLSADCENIFVTLYQTLMSVFL